MVAQPRPVAQSFPDGQPFPAVEPVTEPDSGAAKPDAGISYLTGLKLDLASDVARSKLLSAGADGEISRSRTPW